MPRLDPVVELVGVHPQDLALLVGGKGRGGVGAAATAGEKPHGCAQREDDTRLHRASTERHLSISFVVPGRRRRQLSVSGTRRHTPTTWNPNARAPSPSARS